MRPTNRCLLLYALGLPLAALPVLIGPELWTVWLMWVGIATLLMGLDAILSLPRSRLHVEVEIPNRLYVGESEPAVVTLAPRRRGPTTRAEVLADLSEDLLPQAIQPAALPAGEATKIEIPLVSLRRGTAVLERLWVRWTGPFGLTSRHKNLEQDLDVSVVPNIGIVRQKALEFSRQRDVLIGARAVKFVGEGSEFDAMREYVRGLDHRSINWKVSARHRTLICQEFRAERNHRVVIAFDTGHLMSQPLGGIPKLDHAIHAGLVLAYACLRAGDRVGMFAFDERVRSYMAPQGDMQSFPKIQHATGALDYTTAETNFTLGLAELTTRLTRRSLVVVLTDFVDTITAELMVENAARLARRHLVVFVTLRDPHLGETTWQAPHSMGSLFRSVVASDFVRQRDLVLKRLDRLGVFHIDAPPEGVSTQLLNRYFQIKRREMI